MEVVGGGDTWEDGKGGRPAFESGSLASITLLCI